MLQPSVFSSSFYWYTPISGTGCRNITSNYNYTMLRSMPSAGSDWLPVVVLPCLKSDNNGLWKCKVVSPQIQMEHPMRERQNQLAFPFHLAYNEKGWLRCMPDISDRNAVLCEMLHVLHIFDICCQRGTNKNLMVPRALRLQQNLEKEALYWL